MSTVLAWLTGLINYFLGMSSSPSSSMSPTAPSEDDQPVLRPIQYDLNSTLRQTQSPLYSVLPPELRDRCFAYALAPYQDPQGQYGAATPYTRPTYVARSIQSTALLRTCRLIYSEAWFYPWTTSTHTFYLGHHARRPHHPTATPIILQPALDTLHALHADGPVELNNIQIFAQLFALEPGNDLANILNMEHFHPKVITITLRHTDWWFWEEDVPLRLAGAWVGECDSLWPSSVQEVRFELESLERRRDQIEDMALQIAEQWGFRRRDGVVLAVEGYAKQQENSATTTEGSLDVDLEEESEPSQRKAPSRIETRWIGSSTLNGARWLRDELPGDPGKLHYYIRTLIFRPLAGAATAPPPRIGPYVQRPSNIETRIGTPLNSDPTAGPSAFEEAVDIEAAGCPPDMPAEEVRENMDAWRRARFADARAAADQERFQNMRDELHGGVSVLDRNRDGNAADGDEDIGDTQAGSVGQARGVRSHRPGRGRPGRGRIAGGPPI